MGGREVGGLANMLAAHMSLESAQDRDRVQRFWRAPRMADKAGLKAVDLFRAIGEGRVKAVWIMGTNPVVSLPDAERVKQALARCECVVVSDCVAQTDTTALAHVLLPAMGWSEKSGTVTNSERRISRQRALFEAAGAAKPDWWIISQVARRLGFDAAFAYRSPVEIFREHAVLSGFENDPQHGLRDFDISAFSDLSQSAYDDLQPTQWPVNRDHPQGRARLFDDGRFFTPSGRAQFVSVAPRSPVHAIDADYPLILNTGRVRDQWHTMTRTGLVAKLNQHKPEPFVEIHPLDAVHHGVAHHDVARMESAWGNLLARVHVSDAQTPGNVFVPMHWSETHARRGRVGALINPVIDPLSRQPESKHTPVKIARYRAAWYGFLLSRRELKVCDADYWVGSRSGDCQRHELAGATPIDDWPTWARRQLAPQEPAEEAWLEYQDPGLGIYRAALLIEGRLEGVLFIAAQPQLPERQWLMSLFGKVSLDGDERKALLTGKPPMGTEDVGAMVCACFQVGENTLRHAIQTQGLKTVQDVGRCLKAGSNCGSCIPEIKRFLG